MNRVLRPGRGRSRPEAWSERARHRTAGAGSGSSRTRRIHLILSARRDLLVVLGAQPPRRPLHLVGRETEFGQRLAGDFGAECRGTAGIGTRPRNASLTDRNCEGFCRPGNRVGLPGRMVEPDGIEPTTSSMPCMLPFLDRQPAGMRPYTRKTSSEKCALASLMPTDFIFPSAAALAVTTFPQSADTDGEAVTTSRLRPARTPARGCARGAAMWRSPLGASAVRVDAPPSLPSVRFSIVHKPEERQRAQRPGLLPSVWPVR